ncbi:unnamed protein product [Amoebophrya sp. A120]|nr:unnamed protein product [Amoebophrya sp. A120]|eukprot:GSA120T00010653001.1
MTKEEICPRLFVCTLGDKCPYAHSEREIIRPELRDKKYKRRRCMYRDCDVVGCFDAHSEYELAATNNLYKLDVCKYLPNCPNGDKCTFCHVEPELEMYVAVHERVCERWEPLDEEEANRVQAFLDRKTEEWFRKYGRDGKPPASSMERVSKGVVVGAQTSAGSSSNHVANNAGDRYRYQRFERKVDSRPGEGNKSGPPSRKTSDRKGDATASGVSGAGTGTRSPIKPVPQGNNKATSHPVNALICPQVPPSAAATDGRATFSTTQLETLRKSENKSDNYAPGRRGQGDEDRVGDQKRPARRTSSGRVTEQRPEPTGQLRSAAFFDGNKSTTTTNTVTPDLATGSGAAAAARGTASTTHRGAEAPALATSDVSTSARPPPAGATSATTSAAVLRPEGVVNKMDGNNKKPASSLKPLFPYPHLVSSGAAAAAAQEKAAAGGTTSNVNKTTNSGSVVGLLEKIVSKSTSSSVADESAVVENKDRDFRSDRGKNATPRAGGPTREQEKKRRKHDHVSSRGTPGRAIVGRERRRSHSLPTPRRAGDRDKDERKKKSRSPRRAAGGERDNTRVDRGRHQTSKSRRDRVIAARKQDRDARKAERERRDRALADKEKSGGRGGRDEHKDKGRRGEDVDHHGGRSNKGVEKEDHERTARIKRGEKEERGGNHGSGREGREREASRRTRSRDRRRRSRSRSNKRTENRRGIQTVLADRAAAAPNLRTDSKTSQTTSSSTSSIPSASLSLPIKAPEPERAIENNGPEPVDPDLLRTRQEARDSLLQQTKTLYGFGALSEVAFNGITIILQAEAKAASATPTPTNATMSSGSAPALARR